MGLTDNETRAVAKCKITSFDVYINSLEMTEIEDIRI
jgi:hypothetical protein